MFDRTRAAESQQDAPAIPGVRPGFALSGLIHPHVGLWHEPPLWPSIDGMAGNGRTADRDLSSHNLGADSRPQRTSLRLISDRSALSFLNVSLNIVLKEQALTREPICRSSDGIDITRLARKALFKR